MALAGHIPTRIVFVTAVTSFVTSSPCTSSYQPRSVANSVLTGKHTLGVKCVSTARLSRNPDAFAILQSKAKGKKKAFLYQIYEHVRILMEERAQWLLWSYLLGPWV
jgi:hypothetical protein